MTTCSRSPPGGQRCARDRDDAARLRPRPLPTWFDASVEAYAAFAGNLARDLGCHAVVGHSFGANVAIEMAVVGHFGGHLILLAPTFSAEDEMRGLATFNRIGYVPGLRSLVTALLFRSFPKMLKGSPGPRRPARRRDGEQRPRGHPPHPAPLL